MHMEAIKQVGGACGEIECLLPEKKEDGSSVTFMESVLLRSQYVEYKLSHYLDKSTETLFGFVSVLPGAFSTFRWECINGSPLDEFLKGAADEFHDLHQIRPCSEANKYLAEDRIMCLEIIAKKNCEYIIHYVPGAQCLTDPPLTLTQLIKQRRRWFNGSMFASIHVLKHMCKVWRRKKRSCFRNFAFMILYFYMTIQMVLSFFIVGNFYGVFNIFIRSFWNYDDCFSFTAPANFVINLYILFLILTMMLSSTISIQWAEYGYRATSVFMGLFTLLMIGSSFLLIGRQEINVLGLVFLFVYLISFLCPLCCNCKKLK
jgi:chitin synthase